MMTARVDPPRWRRPQAAAFGATALPAGADLEPSAEDRSFGAAFHMFSLFTFILIGRPQDYVPALIPLRLAVVGTGLTVAFTIVGSAPAARGLFAARETRLYLLFYAAMIGGIPFAVYRPGAFDAVIMQYVVNVAYFCLFLVHVDSVEKLKRIAVVLVISIFILTVFGLQNGDFTKGRYDTGSRMYDPNDVAFVEVSLLAFALWILTGSFGIIMKAVALASLVCGTLLVLFTASRGGLLGLVTFFILFMVLRVNTIKKPFKLLVAAALVTAAITQSDKINLDRYKTLGSIEQDYNFEDGGRADIWKRGWKLFLADPLTGVGVDGFGKAIGDMRAAERGEIPRWQTAHSSYVLVLTETGIVGSTAFLLLILTCLTAFNRLRRKRHLIADPQLQALPGLLLIGFGAQLVAAAFLSQAYSMFFTLAFAMSGALTRLTAAPQAVPADEAAGDVQGVTPVFARRPFSWSNG